MSIELGSMCRKGGLDAVFECDRASKSQMLIAHVNCSMVCRYEICCLCFAKLA